MTAAARSQAARRLTLQFYEVLLPRAPGFQILLISASCWIKDPAKGGIHVRKRFHGIPVASVRARRLVCVPLDRSGSTPGLTPGSPHVRHQGLLRHDDL